MTQLGPNMRKLTALELTIGECQMVSQLAHFLSFMKDASAAVPEDNEEFDTLLAAYVKAARKEVMLQFLRKAQKKRTND